MNDQFDEAMHYYNKATEYYRKQDFDNAISAATQAISAFPELAPVYNVRGNAFYGKKDYIKSIEDQTLAIKYTEKEEKEFQQLKSKSGDAQLDEAINELMNFKAFIYFNRGNAYDDSDDFENAEIDFSESIRLNPEFANAYNSRGIVYKKNGDYISAVEDFTKAIQYNYEEIKFVYNNRAQVLQYLGRHHEALADCQKAIEIDPLYANAYNTCGNIYEEMNDIENAVLFYKKAIAADPDDPTPKYNIERLAKGIPLDHSSSTRVSLNRDDGPDFFGVK